mmetsp:Transcript_78750/g.220740  ORF Transcript_78750/g.220740 Transcript_78750/m.220740 type:complete len:266 (-) Transcript_78750:37-834(-)
MRSPCSVASGHSTPLPEQAEQVQEEVDDVEVQVQRGKAVVVDAELDRVAAPEHQLRVEDDVEGKEQHGAEVVEHDHPLDVPGTDKHAHDADGQRERHQRHHGREQVQAVAGEVDLRRPREDGHADKDDRGDARGKCYALPCVHGRGEADHDGHAQRQRKEDGVVRGKLPQQVRAAACRQHGHNEHTGGHEQHPLVARDLLLAHGHDRRGDRDSEQQLHRQDAVHLAHEALADFIVGILQGALSGQERRGLGGRHRGVRRKNLNTR